MQQQWNDTDRGKPKDSKKNLSQCYSVHYKSYIAILAANPGLHGEKPVSNHLCYGMTI
jgi:hypothetical protein